MRNLEQWNLFFLALSLSFVAIFLSSMKGETYFVLCKNFQFLNDKNRARIRESSRRGTIIIFWCMNKYTNSYNVYNGIRKCIQTCSKEKFYEIRM